MRLGRSGMYSGTAVRDLRRQLMTRGKWKEQTDAAAVALQREARILAVQADIRREMDRRYPGWDQERSILTNEERTEVIRLRREEGLSYAQIAARLGCTCHQIGATLRQAGLNSCRWSRYHAARRRHA
jgi:DNA-directed RNA polymerase specialized sigma24 family protein